jgi:DNA-binding CsgD family transcriptional regulator
VEVVRLGPFAVSEVAAVLAGAGQVDPTWPGYVHRRTGGNPLYVRELARVLTQQGVLAGPARDLPLPTELCRLIGYRLDRLSKDCQRLLGVCSAIGDEVDAGLLDQVADLLPGPVAPLLAEAVSAGVLVEDPRAPAVLRFSHAVVREARYGSLDRVERLAVHRRIAEALEAGNPGDERAGERARHRIRAAVDPAGRHLAALACRGAAEAARRRRAVDEAQHWYTHALELWSTDEDDPGRAALLVDAAEAAYCVGLIAQALTRCTAAADVAERIGRPDLVAAAALVVRGIGGSPLNAAIVRLCERARAVLPDADVAGHAQLLAQQAFATSEVADAKAAELLSARALALAERSADPDALVAALHARHQVLVGLAHVAQRLRLGTRMRALAPATERPDAALWGHLWRIEAQFQLGAVEALDAELRELAELADQRGGPLPRWHLRRAQAARAIMDGRFADAARLADEARDVAAQIQDESAQYLYYAQVSDLLRLTGQFDELRPRIVEVATALPLPVAWAGVSQFLLQAGDREAAVELYERARAALPTLPRNTRWFPTVALTAAVAAQLGDAETGTRCYELLRPDARYFVNSAVGTYGAVSRILGEVALALGRLDEADLLLGKAVRMETRIGALPFAVLAQLSHATVLARRDAAGDRDRAGRLAERAGRTARRLGMVPAADRAAAVAAGLAATARAAQPHLTAREREIAALVAQGLANRAIAGKLVLSERTVEAHVRSILAKLGMSNRTQVAAWAVRTGA